eukprot:840231-Pleurochrysis_carterae.AAC.6
MGLCMQMLSLVVSVVVTILCAITVGRILQARRRGFYLSCSILCSLSAASGVAQHSLYVAMYVGQACNCQSCWPYAYAEFNTIETIVIFVHATSLALAYFNLGLMWIEFMISSQRAENVGSNLRGTAAVIYAFIVMWSAASAVLFLLYHLKGAVHQFVWIVLSVIAAFAATVIHVTGGRAMRDLFLRALQRSRQQAAFTVVEDPSLSASETQKAERMRLRAKSTQQAYWTAGCCVATYVCTGLIAELLYALKMSLGTALIFAIFQRSSMYCLIGSMCCWLYISIEIEQLAARCNDGLRLEAQPSGSADQRQSTLLPALRPSAQLSGQRLSAPLSQQRLSSQPAPAMQPEPPAEVLSAAPVASTPAAPQACHAECSSAVIGHSESRVDACAVLGPPQSARAALRRAEANVRECINQSMARANGTQSQPETRNSNRPSGRSCIDLFSA